MDRFDKFVSLLPLSPSPNSSSSAISIDCKMVDKLVRLEILSIKVSGLAILLKP